MARTDQSPKLILASRSPRRRELLAEAGYRFTVCPPSASAESGDSGGQRPERPEELVARLAHQKAADVVRRVEKGVENRVENRVEKSVEKGLILACDTVAECDGRILGKPSDEIHARQMLETLRGRQHRVFTGLCLWKVPEGKPKTRVAVTTLRMDRLSDEQIDTYITSGGWSGKAGAFGYQDRLGWVHVIEGSESNVVGLPLELLAEMLAEMPEID